MAKYSSNISRIFDLISNSIKESDKTIFFENYSQQARSVLLTLEKNGYKIIPSEPTDQMIKIAVKSIELGTVDARSLAKKIYKDMIINFEKD